MTIETEYKNATQQLINGEPPISAASINRYHVGWSLELTFDPTSFDADQVHLSVSDQGELKAFRGADEEAILTDDPFAKVWVRLAGRYVVDTSGSFTDTNTFREYAAEACGQEVPSPREVRRLIDQLKEVAQDLKLNEVDVPDVSLEFHAMSSACGLL